jgi:hypothetical protein
LFVVYGAAQVSGKDAFLKEFSNGMPKKSKVPLSLEGILILL